MTIEQCQLQAWTGGGKDQDKVFKDRMELYSKVLQDGDFERWQKFCYIDKNSREFKQGYINALWIFNRFTRFNSPEWSILCQQMRKLCLEQGDL